MSRCVWAVFRWEDILNILLYASQLTKKNGNRLRKERAREK
jgi:hypothetical protein